MPQTNLKGVSDNKTRAYLWAVFKWNGWGEGRSFIVFLHFIIINNIFITPHHNKNFIKWVTLRTHTLRPETPVPPQPSLCNVRLSAKTAL
ncbi:unnamed protein product [Pieris brassicae]|uniref:Uncharacterized protein n=1 Tax=Pieris brassicae TaxID=7116 RepID=A0A9P0TJ21_PIEBR|nr:unnamed protein product [Pieris brassicae]